MSSLGTLRPRGRRRAVLLAAGIAAAAVLAAIAPRAYDAIRREVLIRRLEEGDDPVARGELAEPRHAARLQARIEESGNARLAGPLIDLAAEGRLDPAIRAAVFGRFSRPEFTDGSGTRTATVVAAPPIFPEGLKVSVAMARSGSVHTVDLGEWTGGSYTVPRLSSSGDVVQFMEWFVTGREWLVYQRSTWVIIPPGPGGTPFRVETEDLTDLKDPVVFFLGRPVPGHEGDAGGPGITLTFGFFGSPRGLYPYRPKAFSYSVHLDPSRSASRPVLLGWVVAETTNFSWAMFSQSALAQAAPARDPGDGRFAFLVPPSVARLEPFQKLRLLFRPAPEFAAENGRMSAAAAYSPPFERELYVPPP